jgi:hypothetical protein
LKKRIGINVCLLLLTIACAMGAIFIFQKKPPLYTSKEQTEFEMESEKQAVCETGLETQSPEIAGTEYVPADSKDSKEQERKEEQYQESEYEVLENSLSIPAPQTKDVILGEILAYSTIMILSIASILGMLYHKKQRRSEYGKL